MKIVRPYRVEYAGVALRGAPNGYKDFAKWPGLEHAGVMVLGSDERPVYRAFARCPLEGCAGEVETVMPARLEVKAQCECGGEFVISMCWDLAEIGRVTQIASATVKLRHARGEG